MTTASKCIQRLYKNFLDISQVFQTNFDIMPEQILPLTAYSAILLCTENTFWYKSQYSSFLDAFKQAFKLYMEMGVEKNGENAVKLLGDWPVTTPEQEIYRSMLTKILLEHRLPRPE